MQQCVCGGKMRVKFHVWTNFTNHLNSTFRQFSRVFCWWIASLTEKRLIPYYNWRRRIQTPDMERIVKKGNSFYPLSISTRRSILDACQSSEDDKDVTDYI